MGGHTSVTLICDFSEALVGFLTAICSFARHYTEQYDGTSNIEELALEVGTVYNSARHVCAIVRHVSS